MNLKDNVNPILLLDEEGVILQFNDKAKELIGYSDTTLVGQKIDKLFPESNQNLVASEGTTHFISQLTTGEGEKISVVGISSSIIKNNCLFYYLALYNTSLMFSQNEDDKLLTMRILTRNIAHDFDGVLSSIRSSINLLRGNFKSDNIDKEKNINDMDAKLDDAKQLVGKMLEFSQADVSSFVSNTKVSETSHSKNTSNSDKILLIENDPTLASSSVGLLKALGYSSVDIATDISESIKLFANSYKENIKYLFVICDLNVEDCLTAVDLIRRLDKHVKIILTSTLDNEDVMVNFHEYGFKTTLKKPYNIRELYEAVETALADGNRN